MLELKAKPAEYFSYQIFFAETFRQNDDLLRLYESNPDWAGMRTALEVSRIYLRHDDPESAWKVLERRIPQSVCGFPDHVAPVAWLVDETLQQLMTPDRCELVLSTPRGRQACKP